ncbi:uncharacterized protein METZ01_LOCUS407450, partial [marine metagenome]
SPRQGGSRQFKSDRDYQLNNLVFNLTKFGFLVIIRI